MKWCWTVTNDRRLFHALIYGVVHKEKGVQYICHIPLSLEHDESTSSTSAHLDKIRIHLVESVKASNE